MVKKSVTVNNETGLHARPASQLTQLCRGFSNEIRIIHGDKEFDPKNIVSMLMAGIKKGTEIEIQVTGDNENEVCEKIVDFISNLTE